jgi:hypothetical protein
MGDRRTISAATRIGPAPSGFCSGFCASGPLLHPAGRPEKDRPSRSGQRPGGGVPSSLCPWLPPPLLTGGPPCPCPWPGSLGACSFSFSLGWARPGTSFSHCGKDAPHTRGDLPGRGDRRRTAPAGEGLAGSGPHRGWVRASVVFTSQGKSATRAIRVTGRAGPTAAFGSVSGRATTPCARCPRQCWTAGRPALALVPDPGRRLADSPWALRLRAAGPGSRRRPCPGHRPHGPGP